MQLLSLVFVAVPLLGAAACSTAPEAPLVDTVRPDGLALTVDAEAYARGEAARLTFHNGTDALFQTGVLGCARLERPAGDGWEQAPEGNDRMCAAVVVLIEPGETTEAEIPLDVSPGTYRFTYGGTLGDGDRQMVATEPFRVTG